MEKREYNVYSFEELSEKGKTKAIEDFRQSQYEYGMEAEFEFLIDEIKEELKSYGIDVDKIYCSWDRDRYLQLDKVEVESATFIKAYFQEFPHRRSKTIIRLTENGKLCFFHSLRGYSGSRDKDSEIVGELDLTYNSQKSEDNLKWLYDLLDEIKQNTYEKFQDYITRFEKEEESITSDEQIIEDIKANEYMFRENGKID